MARVKEATLKVRSVIQNLDENMLPEGEDEVFDFLTEGFLRYDNDGPLSIRYTEEGEGGKTLTEILFERGLVRVTRHGGVSSELCFYESGIEHESLYTVGGAYSFDISVIPLKIRNGITKDGGTLDIFYRMCIGGAHKKVRYYIEVKVK